MTSPNTKHCVCNTSWFSKITDITNTATEIPNTVCGQWTCRPVMFVDFFAVMVSGVTCTICMIFFVVVRKYDDVIARERLV